MGSVKAVQSVHADGTQMEPEFGKAVEAIVEAVYSDGCVEVVNVGWNT